MQQYANSKGLELGVYDAGVNGNAGSQTGYLSGGRDEWRMKDATGELATYVREFILFEYRDNCSPYHK